MQRDTGLYINGNLVEQDLKFVFDSTNDPIVNKPTAKITQVPATYEADVMYGGMGYLESNNDVSLAKKLTTLSGYIYATHSSIVVYTLTYDETNDVWVLEENGNTLFSGGLRFFGLDWIYPAPPTNGFQVEITYFPKNTTISSPYLYAYDSNGYAVPDYDLEIDVPRFISNTKDIDFINPNTFYMEYHYDTNEWTVSMCSDYLGYGNFVELNNQFQAVATNLADANKKISISRQDKVIPDNIEPDGKGGEGKRFLADDMTWKDTIVNILKGVKIEGGLYGNAYCKYILGDYVDMTPAEIIAFKEKWISPQNYTDKVVLRSGLMVDYGYGYETGLDIGYSSDQDAELIQTMMESMNPDVKHFSSNINHDIYSTINSPWTYYFIVFKYGSNIGGNEVFNEVVKFNKRVLIDWLSETYPGIVNNPSNTQGTDTFSFDISWNSANGLCDVNVQGNYTYNVPFEEIGVYIDFDLYDTLGGWSTGLLDISYHKEYNDAGYFSIPQYLNLRGDDGVRYQSTGDLSQFHIDWENTYTIEFDRDYEGNYYSVNYICPTLVGIESGPNQLQPAYYTSIFKFWTGLVIDFNQYFIDNSISYIPAEQNMHDVLFLEVSGLKEVLVEGEVGLVPKPTRLNEYLCSDGTWKKVDDDWDEYEE